MKVSIIGAAGTVGSCTAFAIATQGLADELVMIDLNQNLLASHVMDIGTAATLTHNIVVRSGNDEDLAELQQLVNDRFNLIKSLCEMGN